MKGAHRQVFQIPILTDSYCSGVFSVVDEKFSMYSPNSDEFFSFIIFLALCDQAARVNRVASNERQI